MKKILIIGTGGHGKDILDVINEIGSWEEVSFLDDKNKSYPELGIKTIGKISDASNFVDEYEDAFVAIGNNSLRLELIHSMKKMGFKIPKLVHPKAIVSKTAEISEGSVILAGAVINTLVRLGVGTIVNIASSIGHETFLEDGVQVSPGANIGGCSHIGRNTWICIGSNVSNNINICENSTIGAGAVVVKDITEPGTYVGVPVRRVD